MASCAPSPSSLNELKTMPRDGAVAASSRPWSLERTADAARGRNAYARRGSQAASAPTISMCGASWRRTRSTRRSGAASRLRRRLPWQNRSRPIRASLAPLDAFAARGIPPEATYLRDIVPVLQRLADGNAAKAKPAGAESPTGGRHPAIACSRASQNSCGSSGTRDPQQPPRLPPQPARLRCAARTWPRPERMSPTCRRRPIRRSRPGSSRWMRARRRLRPSQKFSAEALAAFGKSGQ